MRLASKVFLRLFSRRLFVKDVGDRVPFDVFDELRVAVPVPAADALTDQVRVDRRLQLF